MKLATQRWGWVKGAEQRRTPVDAKALAFDVVVVVETAGERRVGIDEFLAMPLDTRIRLNFERKLRFLRGNEAVPAAEALASLMAAARAAG